jgi:hypothetical protein
VPNGGYLIAGSGLRWVRIVISAAGGPVGLRVYPAVSAGGGGGAMMSMVGK